MLVATQPVWAAIIARRRGHRVEPGTWAGIGVALCGAVLLTGVDLSVFGRALFGDLLALAGGMLSAAYVTVGAEVCRTVSTGSYAFDCYATAATLPLMVGVVARQPLTGYDAGTWWATVVLVAGAQLFGHTLVNRALHTISATTVSVAIVFEILGASVIARLAFDETPPAAAWPAAFAWWRPALDGGDRWQRRSRWCVGSARWRPGLLESAA